MFGHRLAGQKRDPKWLTDAGPLLVGLLRFALRRRWSAECTFNAACHATDCAADNATDRTSDWPCGPYYLALLLGLRLVLGSCRRR
jgi:hypothetical protein